MKVILSILTIAAMMIPAGAVTELTVEWTINTSDVFHGLTFGAGHQGCQTVWDIDGDGANEIVFGTRRYGGETSNKRLWCFDSDQKLEWIYPPIDRDGLPGDPTSKVSLVDVDGDGVYELCLGGRGGRLHVLDGDGHVVWTWDDPFVSDGQALHGSPQAFDVDGDGFVEFFLADAWGYIHRVSHEGHLVWTSQLYRPGTLGHVTICDLEGDGRYEVAWTPYHGDVYCIDAHTGEHVWTFDTHANPHVIVADVDGDRMHEVLAWTEGELPGGVHCLDMFGREIWRWAVPGLGNIRMCQAMGDVDGDDSLELVVASDTGIYCIDIGGGSPQSEWVINLTRWSEEGLLPEGAVSSHWGNYQLIADFDGDGDQEVLLLAPFPVVVDGATGGLEAYYADEYSRQGTRPENGGWWGDVDGDGVSEWICEITGFTTGADTMLYCLTMSGEFPAESPWPEYYHCAYPAEYQQEEDWLTLKAAYSNSLWFPIPGGYSTCLFSLLCLALTAKRKKRKTDNPAGSKQLPTLLPSHFLSQDDLVSGS